MQKKYILIGVSLIIILALIFLLVGDKNLNLKSPEIEKLYSYLGEVDVYHCGGLNTYSSEAVTKDTLTSDTRLCMAYYNIPAKDISSQTVEITGKNANSLNICKVGEGTTLSAGDNSNCAYTKISKESLKQAYLEIYGEEPKKYEEFNISNTKSCYLEEDTYYCGDAETYSISIMPETNIYRLKKSALKRFNGDIIISDYFLKIANNKCYLTASGEEESSTCTEALSKYSNFDSLSNAEKAQFVKKYGKLYKHVYKELNNNYYWSKSY